MDIEALMEKHGDNILRLCYLYLLSAGWGTGGGRGPRDLCPGRAGAAGKISGGGGPLLLSDCSTAEIAQALDLPQGTVSIRLKRPENG